MRVTVTLTLLEAETAASALARIRFVANKLFSFDNVDKRALFRASKKFDDAVLAAQRPPTVKETHEDHS